jgi:hypothetical protein
MKKYFKNYLGRIDETIYLLKQKLTIMKRKLFSTGLTILILTNFGFSQKTSEDEKNGNVTFNVQSKEDPKKRVSYTGFAFEYVMPNYKFAEKNFAFTGNGFALNVENYFPLTSKTALALNLSFVNLEQIRNTEVNLGYYILPYKGFYLKPQVGLGFYGVDDEYSDFFDSKFNYTYRGQVGYLFEFKSKSGKQHFIDIGYAFHKINNTTVNTAYNGISIKYLWQSKN